MKSLFISYARDDGEEISGYFQKRLSAAGADVYRDQERLEPGPFPAQLENNIVERDALLVFLTPSALKSEWVRREVLLARERGLTVIAFKCWQQELPDYLPEEQAPLIENSNDRNSWISALHKTLTYLEEEGENIPRIMSFSKQQPVDDFEVRGLLVLNQPNRADVDTCDVEAVERFASAAFDIYHEHISIVSGYIAPSLAPLAVCTAAALSGKNYLPRVYWTCRKDPRPVNGQEWEACEQYMVHTGDLRDRVRDRIDSEDC